MAEKEQDGSRFPKFLILGGCGFIGRHLVEFLLDKSSKIFVIDKTIPEVAWLNERQKSAFQNPKVVFQSANLIKESGCEKAFENIDSDIDYVINLASEIRQGQDEFVYRDGIFQLSSNVIKYVKEKLNDTLKTYVHFSSGSLYSKHKVPHKESDQIDVDWCLEAKYKYQAEQEVAKQLKNYIIIRPAIVYGPGDRNGLTPRLVVGAIYKHLNEKMKLPWTAKLRINTIHVEDLSRATYHLCQYGQHKEIYNAVDKGETTQGKVTTLIGEIFGIQYDYWGTILSTIGSGDVKEFVNDINDKHLTPWANLCSTSGVSNTPLTPYIQLDALHKRHISLDGDKLISSGFSNWQYPEITKEALMEVLNDFIQMNIFPRTVLD